MLQQMKKSLQPKASQVNKPIVMVMAAIIAAMILFAIITAFSTPKIATKSNSITITKIDKATAPAPAINNLPQDYQDAEAIKKYSANFQDQNLINLQKEMNQLKLEHEMMEQQLQNINRGSTHGNRQNDDQAKTSNIFFSGVEPEKGAALNIKNTSDGSSPFARNSSARQDESSLDIGTPTSQTASLAQDFRKHAHYQQQLATMKAKDNPEEIYDLHNVVTPASPYQVQAGTVIPATLITGINTTLVGTVVAQITHNTYDTVTGKYLLIPKGSKVLGDYESRTAYGQRRVLLTFNRIIRPDGSSLLIGKSSSADSQGQAGIEGNVDNHWSRIIGAATLSTILSVGAGIASDSSDKNYYPDARQRAMIGAAGGITQVGQNITNRALDIQPTITLPAGYHFNIVVKKDMVISPPYKR